MRHAIYDTLDKLTPEQLERAVRAHLDTIDKVDQISKDEIKAADMVRASV